MLAQGAKLGMLYPNLYDFGFPSKHGRHLMLSRASGLEVCSRPGGAVHYMHTLRVAMHWQGVGWRPLKRCDSWNWLITMFTLFFWSTSSSHCRTKRTLPAAERREA
jgi:hypothetical protein